eukprot:7953951-Pyramimonas_sp.AAC.1
MTVAARTHEEEDGSQLISIHTISRVLIAVSFYGAGAAALVPRCPSLALPSIYLGLALQRWRVVVHRL